MEFQSLYDSKICSLEDLQFFWKLNVGRLPFGMRVGCAHCPLCGLSTQDLPNNHVVMMCSVTLSCLEKILPFWLKILSNYSAMSLIQTMVESWIHADLPINNVDQACFLMVLSLKRALNHVCTRAIFGGHQVGSRDTVIDRVVKAARFTFLHRFWFEVKRGRARSEWVKAINLDNVPRLQDI